MHAVLRLHLSDKNNGNTNLQHIYIWFITYERDLRAKAHYAFLTIKISFYHGSNSSNSVITFLFLPHLCSVAHDLFWFYQVRELLIENFISNDFSCISSGIYYLSRVSFILLPVECRQLCFAVYTKFFFKENSKFCFKFSSSFELHFSFFVCLMCSEPVLHPSLNLTII